MQSFTDSITQDYCHLKRIDILPKGLQPIAAKNGKFIIAHGESGLEQSIRETPHVELYASLYKYRSYLKITGDAPVVLEHPLTSAFYEDVEVKPGIYLISKLKETCADKEPPSDVEFRKMPKVFRALEPSFLSTEAIDKAAAAQAIQRMYGQIGLENPFIIWTESPFANVIVRSLINGISEREVTGSCLGDVLYGGIDSKYSWTVLQDKLDTQYLHQAAKSIEAAIEVEVSIIRTAGDPYASYQDTDRNFKALDAETNSMMNVVMENARNFVWGLAPELAEFSNKTQAWRRAVGQSQAEFWNKHWKDQLWGAWASISRLQFDSLYGQNWSHRLAYFKFLNDIDALLGFEDLDGLAGLCGTTGSVLPCEKICFVSERHDTLKLNERGQFHCGDGPAFTYPDGYEAYYWNGISYPKDWATTKPSPAEAITGRNGELRRVACEMIGWKTILSEMDCETIEKDKDPEIGALVVLNFPDGTEEKFLRVTCGTGREFALPVPPEMKTALEANAWTWGLEPGEYAPEVRT